MNLLDGFMRMSYHFILTFWSVAESRMGRLCNSHSDISELFRKGTLPRRSYGLSWKTTLKRPNITCKKWGSCQASLRNKKLRITSVRTQISSPYMSFASCRKILARITGKRRYPFSVKLYRIRRNCWRTWKRSLGTYKSQVKVCILQRLFWSR